MSAYMLGEQYFPVSVKGQRSGDATQLKIQFVLSRGFGMSSNIRFHYNLKHKSLVHTVTVAKSKAIIYGVELAQGKNIF